MRRKSDLPNQRQPPPATPVKQTGNHIRKTMNTPSRMPNRLADTPYNDSPFFTPTRYAENSDYNSSPIKQILSIPFEYSINEQFDNIYHVSIKHQNFVVKRCNVMELQIYQKLNSIKTLEDLLNSNNHIMPTFMSTPFVIMPFCTPLDKLMYAYELMPLLLVKQFTRQLFQGLAYIHSNNILHGDIKPPNILIYDAEIPLKCSQPMDVDHHEFANRLYISDFSVSQQEPFAMMEYGDPLYYSPEAAQTTSLKADIFSAGLVIYELLENIIMPQNGDELYKAVRNNDFSFSRQDSQIIAVILNCCEKNKDKRWSAATVLGYLENEE